MTFSGDNVKTRISVFVKNLVVPVSNKGRKNVVSQFRKTCLNSCVILLGLLNSWEVKNVSLPNSWASLTILRNYSPYFSELHNNIFFSLYYWPEGNNFTVLNIFVPKTAKPNFNTLWKLIQNKNYRLICKIYLIKFYKSRKMSQFCKI